jgi:5S rRNA maturation endonuclease (ribonuclease M5)
MHVGWQGMPSSLFKTGRVVDFKIQSDTQKEFLARATHEYHTSLVRSPVAQEYLENRGLILPGKERELSLFRIGFVDNPLPGHEWYKGWLALPYIRKGPSKGWSVVGMKFRCLEQHEGPCSEAHPKRPKYIAHGGNGTHLFNTIDLQNSDDEIVICEGEIDAITAHLCGLPSIGVPGVENWKDFYFRLLRGYKKIWMFADGDSYGEGLAKKIADRMGDKVSVIKMPDKEDVNSMVKKYGAQALLKGMGRE